MQIVINFNDIDLNDWIDFDEDCPTTPELKDVFKGEILYRFVEKLNADFEVRKYVRENIDNALAIKISAYKDDVAIKAIVEKIIERRLMDTGSFIFLDRYEKDVQKAVDKYLKAYESKVNTAVLSAVHNATEDIINRLYANSAMREFIDIEKLSAYVMRALPGKTED